jgi:hypothetical protein
VVEVGASASGVDWTINEAEHVTEISHVILGELTTSLLAWHRNSSSTLLLIYQSRSATMKVAYVRRYPSPFLS